MFEQNPILGPGTGTFASHSFEILIMLLGAFLLGVWLGWILWAKYKQAVDKLTRDNQSLEASLQTLNTELGSSKTRMASISTELSDMTVQVGTSNMEIAALRAALSAAEMGQRVAEDRNRQLETELGLAGISTEDNGAFVEDIPLEIVPNSTSSEDERSDTYIQDEKTSEVDTVISTEITITGPDPVATVTLEPEPVEEKQTEEPQHGQQEDAPMYSTDDPDVAFVMEEPSSLESFVSISRSSLAAPVVHSHDSDHFSDEAFMELTRSTLAPPVQTTQELESMPFVLTPISQDDLKIVEGIGPKIEQLLFQAGIHTYDELAAAPVVRLKEILDEAGPRFSMHDPGTWSAQSLLAANGEWENLKAYQDFLNAGKRPNK